MKVIWSIMSCGWRASLTRLCPHRLAAGPDISTMKDIKTLYFLEWVTEELAKGLFWKPQVSSSYHKISASM
jgi:hypothetical protein